jgi:hypothetical protein
VVLCFVDIDFCSRFWGSIPSGVSMEFDTSLQLKNNFLSVPIFDYSFGSSSNNDYSSAIIYSGNGGCPAEMLINNPTASADDIDAAQMIQACGDELQSGQTCQLVCASAGFVPASSLDHAVVLSNVTCQNGYQLENIVCRRSVVEIIYNYRLVK